MSNEKVDTMKKNDRPDASVRNNSDQDRKVESKPTDDQSKRVTQGSGQTENKPDSQRFADKSKETNSQHYSEEKNVGAKEYMQNDKKNLNGSKDQRI